MPLVRTADGSLQWIEKDEDQELIDPRSYGVTNVDSPDIGDLGRAFTTDLGKGIAQTVGRELIDPISESLDANEDDNIVQAAIKTPLRVGLNAAVNAVQEGSDTIRDLSEWSGLAPEGFGTNVDEKDKPILGLGDWKPRESNIDEAWAKDVEGLSTGVVQFIAEFMLLSKALRGINWAIQSSKIPGLARLGQKASQFSRFTETGFQAHAASKTAALGRALGLPKGASAFVGTRLAGPTLGAAYNATLNPKGMLVDFAGFDQWEGRLYDLAANSEWFGWVENIPFAQGLASDPDDSAMEGRLKNVVEGWAIDFGMGTLFKGFRASNIDVADLIVDSVKGKGYTQQLLTATKQFGENSPQVRDITEKITLLTRKLSESPIVRKVLGDVDPNEWDFGQRSLRETRVENLPDANTSFQRRQLEVKIQELQQQLKSLGAAPQKPAKGTFFEIINGRKVKTASAKAYSAWSRKASKINKELNSLLEQQKQFEPSKVADPEVKPLEETEPEVPVEQTFDDSLEGRIEELDAAMKEAEDAAEVIKEDGDIVGMTDKQEKGYINMLNLRKKLQAELDAQTKAQTENINERKAKTKEREAWDRRRTDDDKANGVLPSTAKGNPNGGYTREQQTRGRQAVQYLAHPDGRPMTPAEKELIYRRFMEQKFGRLERSQAPRNRLYQGMSDEEYAKAIESRVALIVEIIRKVGGEDVVARYHDVYGKGTRGVEYGGVRGETEAVDILGQYDFVDDVLDVYGLMKGDTNEYVGTVYHELFHRIQQVALNKKQLAVADTVFARLKVLVYTQLSGATQKSYMESMTHAFERIAVAKHFGKDPVYALLSHPGDTKTHKLINRLISAFDPVLDLIEKTYNYVTDPKGKGFNSIRQIFEDAYDGKFSNKTQPEVAAERAKLKEILAEMDKLPDELPLDREASEEIIARALALRELQSHVANSLERANVHPGGIWRTRDEGYRKLPQAEMDRLDDILNNQRRGELRSERNPNEFVMPNKWQRMGTRYGLAQLTWQSDLDRLAWILRGNRKSKYPNTAPEMRTFLEKEGYDIREIERLGNEIHERIQEAMEEATGSRSAGPSSRGVELEVPRSENSPQGKVPEVEPEPEAPRVEEPEVEPDAQSTVEINQKEISGITEKFAQNMEKLENGEIELKDMANNIINIISESRTTKGKINQYGPATNELIAILNASSELVERVMASRFKRLNTSRLLDEIMGDVHKWGLNLSEIENALRPLANNLLDNEKVVSNFIKLRVAVIATNRQAGIKAANVLNGMKRADIDYDKAARELEAALIYSLKLGEMYRGIISPMAQVMQSTQVKIGSVDKIKLIEDKIIAETKPKFTTDLRAVTEELENIEAGLKDIEGKSNLAESVRAVLPDDVIVALETGQWSTRAKQSFNAFANEVATDAFTPGEGVGTIRRLIDGPNPYIGTEVKEAIQQGLVDKVNLLARTLTTHRVNGLLSGGLTYAVQISIPYTRLLTAPAIDLFNHTVFEKGKLINLEAGAKRLPFTYIWYRQMAMMSLASLRLGKRAFLDGHTYFDPYRRAGAFDVNQYKSMDEAVSSLEKGPIQFESEGTYSLNEMEFFDYLKEKNPIMHGLTTMYHRFATFDIRFQGAIETAQKALAGNSMLYAIGFEEGLDAAAREGLERGSREAWHFAEEWAESKVKYFTRDAIINGKEVSQSIMTHPAALKIGRFFTFTDDIAARMEPRTFERGQILAEEVGIDPTDTNAINQYAEDYINGKIDMRRRSQLDWMQSLATLRKRDAETQLPLPGELTPKPTRVWSYLPNKWSELQRKKAGWIATMIQPFVRTPADITKQALRGFPIIPVDTMYRDLFDETSVFSKSWKGEVAIASTAVLTIWSHLVQNEDWEWTGTGSLNSDVILQNMAAGRLPMSYRYKMRDTEGREIWSPWETYRAYEPVATIISALADFKELSSQVSQQDLDTGLSTIVTSIAARVLSGKLKSTYYTGIADAIDGLLSLGQAVGVDTPSFGRIAPQEGEINRGQRYFIEWMKAFTPFIAPQSSRLRQITQMIDPVRRVVPENTARNVRLTPQQLAEKAANGEAIDVWAWPGSDEQGIPSQQIPFEEVNKDIWSALTDLPRQYINSLKKDLPFFSKDLPARLNWITGQPLYNPGFLHDNEMPLEKEPWLAHLTSAFVLTSLPIAYSFVPVIGSHPAIQGRIGEKEFVELQENQSKQDYVMREMMRLRAFGMFLRPPSPNDIVNGISLSNAAYNQYINYLTLTPHPVTGLTLHETLFNFMTSDRYINMPPDLPPDQNVRNPRAEEVNEIYQEFKRNAKFMFINDQENPYAIEVLQEIKRQEDLRNRNTQVRGLGVESVGEADSGVTRTSAQQYVEELNY